MNKISSDLLGVVAPSLLRCSSPEFLELVDFFIETAMEVARDGGNVNDGLLTGLIINLLAPEQSERLEAKIFAPGREIT